MEPDYYKFAANNKFQMFLHNIGPIFFQYSWVDLYWRLDSWGNLLEKSAFLASKLGNGPLLEHGQVIEILW